MNHIRLIDVYPVSISTAVFLYDLLLERDPAINISHREIPSFDDHRRFVESQPYRAWYLVHADEEPVGAIYLTNPPTPSHAGNEIGIFISKAHQGKGYAKRAICILMSMHPAKRFLANISTGNPRSMRLFWSLGFELVQHTLAKEME